MTKIIGIGIDLDATLATHSPLNHAAFEQSTLPPGIVILYAVGIGSSERSAAIEAHSCSMAVVAQWPFETNASTGRQTHCGNVSQKPFICATQAPPIEPFHHS
jgi:hypothetical protein